MARRDARGESNEGGDGRRPRQGYQDLLVWQKGMELVSAVYRETRTWPREEQYGLIAQVQRAAVSIPSNLAEGHGRSGSREFAHHASIAYGSLCEVETQLLIAEQLGYTNAESMMRLLSIVADVRRLCRGLLRTLNQRTDGKHTAPPSPPERSATP